MEEEITADAAPSLARIMSKEAGCAARVVCLRRGTAEKGGREGGWQMGSESEHG